MSLASKVRGADGLAVVVVGERKYSGHFRRALIARAATAATAYVLETVQMHPHVCATRNPITLSIPAKCVVVGAVSLLRC